MCKVLRAVLEMAMRLRPRGKSRDSPQQKSRVIQSEFGQLSFSDGIWTGHVTSPFEIDIAIAGDLAGPNSRLSEALQSCLLNWEVVAARSRAFIARHLELVPWPRLEDFEIRCACYLWPDIDDYFMLDLSLKGDEHAIYKLEFVNGHPAFFSRDD